MPAALSSKPAVLDTLVALFRERGFEGTSIADISKSTGLGKPSLYHYFPGGKEQMADEVLGLAGTWIEKNIVVPLGARTVAPRTRVRTMLRALDEFYAGGRQACLINVFALGIAREHSRPQLAAAVRAWIDAMTVVARDAGATPKAAREAALDAMIRIEGALVVARALGDPGVFAREIKGIEHLLLGA